MPPKDTDNTSQQPSTLPPSPQPVGINPQETLPQPPQFLPVNVPQNSIPPSPPLKNFPTKKLIIVLVLVLIVIGLATAGFFFIKKSTKTDSIQNKSLSEVQPTPNSEVKNINQADAQNAIS